MKWLYLLLLNACFLVHAQEILTIDTVQDRLIRQLAFFPQEKIHLHIDRTMYVPGEKIWFKAYIVDAFTHQEPTLSQYVYVELINSDDSVKQRVIVSRANNGIFSGYLPILDLIPEGDYTLRAYTRYMENLGDDYFFKKTIRINNLKQATRPQGRQPEINYDVSFYPEGGYLVEGVQNRVAFKALCHQGASEYITGELVDQAGNRLCEVATVFAGMGSFYCIPEAGKAYYLLCKSSSGQEKRFQLPTARRTFTVGATYTNQRHLIQLKKSPDMMERPLYLLVHCKGEALYFALWDFRRAIVSLIGDSLPSGVLQVVLFDELMNPVSERLIFNKYANQVDLVFSSDKLVYQKREKVTSEIYVTDTEGNPLAGHVSVSVTDDRDIAIDTLHTITANLLLSSELKGYIESPDYYLRDNPSATYALDHLMMTHGWRRYAISETLKGNYKRPETGFEVCKELSGLVKGGLLGRPVVNGQALLFSSNGDFGMADTDSAGIFRTYLHYPDSIQVFVQAKNQKGKNTVELALNQEKFPTPKHVPVRLPFSLSGMETENRPVDVTADFMKKAGQRANYDEDMKLIQLSEINVTASVIDKKEVLRKENWATRGSNKTIYHEELEQNHVPDLSYYLLMRGIFSSGLILIDGFVRENIQLTDIDVNEVESIDIFKKWNPVNGIFGPRGSGGAISITTRRGLNSSKESLNTNLPAFISLGYQTPVEFYSPIYETPEAKNVSLPDYRSTIYWKPDVIIPENGKASFDFYTSDAPTTYSVVIEGISTDGKIIRQIQTIEVQ